jgi:hypothetical protein
MSDPLPILPPVPPPRGRSTLDKLAIIFSVILIVTFGLCSVTLINSSSAMNGPVFPISLVIVAICAISLFICGVQAIINAIKRPPKA